MALRTMVKPLKMLNRKLSALHRQQQQHGTVTAASEHGASARVHCVLEGGKAGEVGKTGCETGSSLQAQMRRSLPKHQGKVDSPDLLQ